MFKSIYSRLALISFITTFALLVALPRIPIKFNKYGLNLDSYLGGYYISFGDGNLIYDLRTLKQGLDLKGGIRVVLDADMSKIKESNRDTAISSAVEVIRRRVDLLGVTEPTITPVQIDDGYRIIVEIPGIDDTETAVNLIGQTAQITFRVLAEGNEWSEERFFEYYTNPALWTDSGITGADLDGAEVVFGQEIQQQNTPQIQLKFSNEGREKFAQLAKENINKPIGIFLDNSVVPLSMPVVSPDLADGLAQDPVITGNFSIEDANNLSLQIRAGALPVPVQILEQKTIGATLGSASVNKSFFAGVVGLLLVMFFLIYAYGRLGILANIALMIYTVLVLAIFKLVPVVITLPGIAGFILSIGVAADANILIFERVKEELRWGTPANLAVKFGFDRAWNSIKDSNVASLISAVILFHFGTGAVRGFALTLAIGILVSLFTSIFVVKTLVELFGIGGKNANHKI